MKKRIELHPLKWGALSKNAQSHFKRYYDSSDEDYLDYYVGDVDISQFKRSDRRILKQ